MYARRVEATLNQEGALVLTDLPFHAGESVEVIVMPRSNVVKSYPLCGKPVVYTERIHNIQLATADAKILAYDHVETLRLN